MTNLRQDAGSASELWSGDLGRVRTVGDGAEQVRLRPRKDVAGTYDAGSETVAAYRYDAYGAQSAPASAQYDIHANPVQYAGEYRDALWGGSYLRARWYAPELPLFLSRDPVAHLGRYGYAGGNPVMRVDPSGRSWKSFENSFAYGRMGWQRWLQHFGGSNAWYAHVARLTAGMLLGPLQMVANPAGFINAIVHDTGGMDFFLAAGVLSEGAAGYFGLRLTTITALQSVGGAGQSAVAAVDRSFKHFNAGTFVTGLEYTAGAELDTFLPRLVRASRPSLRAARDWARDTMSTDDVNRSIADSSEPASPRPAPAGDTAASIGDRQFAAYEGKNPDASLSASSERKLSEKFTPDYWAAKAAREPAAAGVANEQPPADPEAQPQETTPPPSEDPVEYSSTATLSGDQYGSLVADPGAARRQDRREHVSHVGQPPPTRTSER